MSARYNALLASEFQSTSVIADGRISGIVDYDLGRMEFQSTSVIADGRIEELYQWVLRWLASFNPRPSLLTDELAARYIIAPITTPFQSTSVIADGRIQASTDILKDIDKFQSTSVIADGRIGLPTLAVILSEQFQSTSVIADGRIYVAASDALGRQGVSIHVRHC